MADTQDSSWVKYYCIVFLLLTGVVGYLGFKIRGERQELEQQIKVAERLVTGKGIAATNRDGVPQTIPGLAKEIHQYVKAHRDAGTGDMSSGSISMSVIDQAAVGGMQRVSAGEPVDEKNRRGGFVTIKRRITYEKTNLHNLYTTLYNIERKPPLKVFDLRWQLMDEREQTSKPFYNIRRPTIQVGIRRPMTSEERRN